MKKVKFEIGWRLYSLIIGLLILIGYLGFSYAYSGTNPSVMGHTASEIEGVCRTDGTGCPSSMTNTGITFIAPVTIATGDKGDKVSSESWKTFDASSKIPQGAKGVILEAVAGATGPDGDPMADKIRADILIRKNSASSSYYLLSGASAGEGDRVSWSGQGIFSIDSDRKFQYLIDNPGFNNGYEIKLIGYF